MVDELRIHVKNRDFQALSKLLQGVFFELQPSDAQSLAHRDVLLEELEIQIEDLKNDAVKRFDKEEFADCLETFEFLLKVNPNDCLVREYLELCKQGVEENAVHQPNRSTNLSAQNDPSLEVTSPARHEGIEHRKETRGSDTLAGRFVEPTELTRRMRAYFDQRDFEALMRVVKEALGKDAGEANSTQHRIDSSRRQEEQLKAEFETHVQNLKDEAVRQFQSAAYDECLGTFQFLCELEPDDPSLRRYLEDCIELSQRQASVSEVTLLDRSPEWLNSQVENHGLARKSNQLAQCSESHNSEQMFPVDDSQLARNNGDILEIPNDRPSEASSAKPTETLAQPESSVRTVWLKLALPALGAVCLLIWLLVPRSGTGLPETPGAEDESWGAPAWIEKAESAMIESRYLTPVNDNVVFYCSRVLESDPMNTKALELKKESLTQAMKQADDLTSKGRYDEAHGLYQALLELPTIEGLNQQSLKSSAKKVAFDSYPVVHDHFIGSCKGTLKINSYALSFVPLGGVKDGFTARLSQIKFHDPEDTLKIEVNQKTYRFEGSSNKNQRDRKEAAQRLHRLLRDRLKSDH